MAELSAEDKFNIENIEYVKEQGAIMFKEKEYKSATYSYAFCLFKIL